MGCNAFLVLMGCNSTVFNHDCNNRPMKTLKEALLQARRQYVYAVSRNKTDLEYLDRKFIDLGLCWWVHLNYPDLIYDLAYFMPNFSGSYYWKTPCTCNTTEKRLEALQKRIELIDIILKNIDQ